MDITFQRSMWSMFIAHLGKMILQLKISRKLLKVCWHWLMRRTSNLLLSPLLAVDRKYFFKYWYCMFDLKACAKSSQIYSWMLLILRLREIFFKIFSIATVKKCFYHWRSFLIPTMNGLSELIQFMQLLEKHNLTKAGFSIRQEVDG